MDNRTEQRKPELAHGGGTLTPPVSRGEKPVSPKRELAALLVLLLALALFCRGAERVLTPKRLDSGAVWDMYLQEPENSIDVLFLGSSLAYCDVAPAVICRESGVTSFVMAGPDQRIPMTYYYLLEALKTQSPQAVLLEATAMGLSDDSPSTKVNLAFMPWSINRLVPTFTLAPAEDRPGLLFPLYAYHDRWDKLTAQDWSKGLLGCGPDPLAGYTFLGPEPYRGGEASQNGLDRAAFRENLPYLEKIFSLCREKGIRFILYLTPTKQPSRELAQELEKAAAAAGIPFMADLALQAEAMGLDNAADYYDRDHLNYRGAEKFSRYLTELFPAWGISSAGNGDSALWQSRAEHFQALKDAAEQKGSRPEQGGAS